MKHLKKLFLLFPLLCCIMGFAVSDVQQTALTQASAAVKTPLQRYGRLKVSGSQLMDRKGRPVQLKGVSTHGLAWYPQYVNKKAFRTLRDRWGAEVIRLAMYTAEYNGYCTGSAQNQKELEKRIDQAVRDCKDLGLYVIIDWHILSDSNPEIYKRQAKAFFRTMAERYCGYDNVIYEICNEPNGDTSWEQIKSYAKPVIRTIRRLDKNAIIIIGTPNWSQDVDCAAASPLKGRHLMYAFHFYASTHKEDLRKKLQTAIDNGLAVFVSEFGVCEASGSGTIDQTQAKRWTDLLEQNKLSGIVWNLSNKEETSALISSNCTKTSGWKRSDLSDSGKWVYDHFFSRSDARS